MKDFTTGQDSIEPNRLRVWWEALRTGLWPIPLGMTFLAVLLFSGASLVDGGAGLEQSVLRRWHLYSGTGEDARNLLSTLAGAIITMSSVVFSITIVALTLAANQFGSRLVRTYITDVRTKLALGLFIMTIIYCLMALRTVDKQMPPSEVPHVTVSIGLLLALVCVLALLFFLHFVARSIVADEVIRRVARELEETIAELPALEADRKVRSAGEILPQDFDDRSTIVNSRAEGYVQVIGYERLAAFCSTHGLHVRLDIRAGTFVCKDGWLAYVYPDEAVTPEIAAAICEQILIGDRRTPTQDIEFSIRHLVDIALRALSPGINDANTSLVVMDYLSGALSRVMRRELPRSCHEDAEGVVRVVGKTSDHAGVIAAALHQIRQAAASHPAVIIGMLRAIGTIAEQVQLAEQRDALLHHVQLIVAAGVRDLHEPADRKNIEEAFTQTRDKLLRLAVG